jgi:hypothetical protein
MQINAVYDKDECEQTETEIGECAEGSVLRLDEHGSENECDTGGSTCRTLHKIISTSLKLVWETAKTNQEPV